jgi:hypothetical protein
MKRGMRMHIGTADAWSWWTTGGRAHLFARYRKWSLCGSLPISSRRIELSYVILIPADPYNCERCARAAEERSR